METLKKIGKGAIIFGVVGVLLALASPAIASMVGVIGGEDLGIAAMDIATKISANALWEGAFFGAFGAIHAAVAPMMDWMFGADTVAAPAVAPAKIVACGHGHDVTIHNTQLQPDIAVAADVKVDAKANLVDGNENRVDNKAKLFTQMIDAERVNAPNLRLVK